MKSLKYSIQLKLLAIKSYNRIKEYNLDLDLIFIIQQDIWLCKCALYMSKIDYN